MNTIAAILRKARSLALRRAAAETDRARAIQLRNLAANIGECVSKAETIGAVGARPSVRNIFRR